MFTIIISLLHHKKVTWKLGNIYRELTTRHIRTPKDSVCTPGWQYMYRGKKKGKWKEIWIERYRTNKKKKGGKERGKKKRNCSEEVCYNLLS